jgi:hypothetical protein
MDPNFESETKNKVFDTLSELGLLRTRRSSGSEIPSDAELRGITLGILASFGYTRPSPADIRTSPDDPVRLLVLLALEEAGLIKMRGR